MGEQEDGAQAAQEEEKVPTPRGDNSAESDEKPAAAQSELPGKPTEKTSKAAEGLTSTDAEVDE